MGKSAGEPENAATLRDDRRRSPRMAALAKEAARKPSAVVVTARTAAPDPRRIRNVREEPAPEEGTPWLVEHFVSLCGTPDAIAALHDAADSLDIGWEELRSE